MSNTFYTAFTVLENFCKVNNYEIVNTTIKYNSALFAKVWITPADGTSSIDCIAFSPTSFMIVGIGDDYSETFMHFRDYADVNTPPLETARPYTE